MARAAFPIQTFQDLDGTPLSSGYLLISLNKEVQSPDLAQVISQSPNRVNLDSTGNIEGTPLFWGNSALIPTDSMYLLSAYTANGQKVLSDVPIIVIGGGVTGGFGVAFGSSFGS